MDNVNKEQLVSLKGSHTLLLLLLLWHWNSIERCVKLSYTYISDATAEAVVSDVDERLHGRGHDNALGGGGRVQLVAVHAVAAQANVCRPHAAALLLVAAQRPHRPARHTSDIRVPTTKYYLDLVSCCCWCCCLFFR